MDLQQMQSNAELVAAMLKSMANPSRLLLLCGLVTRPHTVSELVELTGLSQSAVSQHLARLRDEGIVAAARDAQRMVYSLSNPDIAKILETLHAMYCPDKTG